MFPLFLFPSQKDESIFLIEDFEFRILRQFFSFVGTKDEVVFYFFSTHCAIWHWFLRVEIWEITFKAKCFYFDLLTGIGLTKLDCGMLAERFNPDDKKDQDNIDKQSSACEEQEQCLLKF